MAPGPALGLGGPYSAPFLAMPFPVGWEPEERGQGPGSPLIECSECLGVLENPLDCREIPEKAMATHSSTLAWKTPWMEEPGGLQSMGSLSRTRLSNFTFTFMQWRRKWQPTPVFLPGESQDGGAWWAAIYGVAQSQTQLMRLSSSSSSSSSE